MTDRTDIWTVLAMVGGIGALLLGIVALIQALTGNLAAVNGWAAPAAMGVSGFSQASSNHWAKFLGGIGGLAATIALFVQDPLGMTIVIVFTLVLGSVGAVLVYRKMGDVERYRGVVALGGLLGVLAGMLAAYFVHSLRGNMDQASWMANGAGIVAVIAVLAVIGLLVYQRQVTSS